MDFKKIIAGITIATASCIAITPATAAPTTALWLSMDGSGSIINTNFTLQVNGYVNALNSVFAANPSFYGSVAIGGNIFGRDVAQFFPLTAINDATSLGLLTTAITGLNSGRGGIQTGATAIGDAVTAGTSALLAYQTALGSPLRMLIDVTTDGFNNFGSNPTTASQAAITAGVKEVNCLGIGNNATCAWMAGFGTDFGTVSFANFEAALTTKLLQEIGQVSAPATLALVGLGLVGVALSRRRVAIAG